MEGENQKLLEQVNVVNQQYKQLHKQLDDMNELFDQKKVLDRISTFHAYFMCTRVLAEHFRLQNCVLTRKICVLQNQEREIALQSEAGQLASELQKKLKAQAQENALTEQKW